HHLRTSLYSLVRYRVKYYDDDKDSLQTALIKEFNLAPDYFAGMENDSIKKADSAERAEKDMYANEFHNRITMPRFVMFDACYNGSFHEDDYIAGEYIFNPGNTLAAQGNTRNVLQDRWTIEMIGLLSHGVRAGQYNRLVATLEGHLIGDPTMHFAPIGETATLSADMTVRRGDREYWMQQLDSPWADVRSIAVRMLSDIEPEATWSPRLLEIYRTDAAGTTRMEALKMLSRYCNADFKEAVRLGLNDPYERIARWSAALAAEIGDTDLLPDYISAFVNGNERQRVHYTLGTNMVLFPKEDVRKAIEDFYANNTRYNAEKEKATVVEAMEYNFRGTDKELNEIKDKSLKERKRISHIRHVRNNPHTYNIDDYIAVVADDENPEAVRVNMAEALGWFNYSSRKGDIVAAFEKMLAENSLPDSVRAEMVQTVNRLK
ncbi:MAG: HEAT repeat domain-containing protein, partial [Duncaniella sp.]|nr:HEAT repeat domain-containing protein [Duncaniella sp.]